MPMLTLSVGEKPPLLTLPTIRPPCKMEWPERMTPRSVARRQANRRVGLASRAAARAARPAKSASSSRLTAKPRPASHGLVPVSISLP